MPQKAPSFGTCFVLAVVLAVVAALTIPRASATEDPVALAPDPLVVGKDDAKSPGSDAPAPEANTPDPHDVQPRGGEHMPPSLRQPDNWQQNGSDAGASPNRSAGASHQGTQQSSGAPVDNTTSPLAGTNEPVNPFDAYRQGPNSAAPNNTSANSAADNSTANNTPTNGVPTVTSGEPTDNPQPGGAPLWGADHNAAAGGSNAPATAQKVAGSQADKSTAGAVSATNASPNLPDFSGDTRRALPSRSELSANKSSSGKTGIAVVDSLMPMASGLAIVIGLFLFSVWLFRKKLPRMVGALPSDVFQVLGKSSLDKKHKLHLVRCGGKLALLSISATGMDTVLEIDDPDEVTRIAGMCQEMQPGSATSSFQAILGELGNEPPERRGKSRNRAA